MDDARIVIKLVENEGPRAGNVWMTSVPIQECSPEAIRGAVYEAAANFCRSLGRDIGNFT